MQGKVKIAFWFIVVLTLVIQIVTLTLHLLG